jgi:CheY-like chemotaxis protein
MPSLFSYERTDASGAPAAGPVRRDWMRQPPARATILVVEDEPELRDELVELIQLRGFDVRGAGDAASAEAILRQSDGPWIMLTDLKLPDASGMELIRHVRADELLSARVQRMTIMTGHTELTEQVERDLAANMVDMLLKPIRTAALLASLQPDAQP